MIVLHGLCNRLQHQGEELANAAQENGDKMVWSRLVDVVMDLEERVQTDDPGIFIEIHCYRREQLREATRELTRLRKY